MMKKNSFLRLILCFLSIASSFSVFGNVVNDQLQAIYSNDEQGIVPVNSTQREMSIMSLKKHIRDLETERNDIKTGLIDKNYIMSYRAAAAAAMVGFAFSALPVLVGINEVGLLEVGDRYKSLIVEAISYPSVFLSGGCYTEAKLYWLILGLPVLSTAAAVAARALYKKYNQKKDERLQEIEANIVRDYEIIARLKASRG